MWALIEPLLSPWPRKSPSPRPVADRLCLAVHRSVSTLARVKPSTWATEELRLS